MAATRTVSPPIPARRALSAQLVSGAAASLARVRAAIAGVVDAAQLGPDPRVSVSRWTGGRI